MPKTYLVAHYHIASLEDKMENLVAPPRECFSNFSFYIGVWSINNVVIVSGNSKETQPFIYTYPFPHVYVSQASLPSRLPPNIQQSSLCYTEDPCRLSVLIIAV